MKNEIKHTACSSYRCEYHTVKNVKAIDKAAIAGERVENGYVYTMEGNSGDSCRQKRFAIGYYEIYGYGTPAY